MIRLFQFLVADTGCGLNLPLPYEGHGIAESQFLPNLILIYYFF
jgi:hypothetical protein